MIDNNSKISLTYRLGGEFLLRRGKYTSATLDTKTDSVKNQMICTKSPVYSESKKHSILPSTFIKECMTRPEKPGKTGTIAEWEAYSKWNTWSSKMKINYYIIKFVYEMNGFDPVWELL